MGLASHKGRLCTAKPLRSLGLWPRRARLSPPSREGPRSGGECLCCFAKVTLFSLLSAARQEPALLSFRCASRIFDRGKPKEQHPHYHKGISADLPKSRIQLRNPAYEKIAPCREQGCLFNNDLVDASRKGRRCTASTLRTDLVW